MKRTINGQNIELRDGKLWIDGNHRFLKIGKPLINYASPEQVEALIDDLGIIRDKGFDCLELNCYWHHFDPAGNGNLAQFPVALNRLIKEISLRGMYPCLSVETYGVGGGQLPLGFWDRYPHSIAVNSEGRKVVDREFGYLSAVPSLFNEDYLRLSRDYIRNLVSQVDNSQILWYETTVEPQFMGTEWLDYSAAARSAYRHWLKRHELAGPDCPESYPISPQFLVDPTWNRFRAEWLAQWVNGDALAYRDVAGADAWIASDYLDAAEETMVKRCGNPFHFLRHLSAPNIIQVNWTWHNLLREPNLKAYERVRQVKNETGRDWAITEHMTINGTDYHPEEMEALLRNTIANSTHFGWEFVDINADRDDPTLGAGTVVPGAFRPLHFSVYDHNWCPKPSMAVVEGKWQQWMDEIAVASQAQSVL